VKTIAQFPHGDRRDAHLYLFADHISIRIQDLQAFARRRDFQYLLKLNSVVDLRLSLIILFLIFLSCAPGAKEEPRDDSNLKITYDQHKGTISVFGANEEAPLLVQNAQEGTRPYIHLIMAPDGKGELTELSPSHHKHQTGLYWGLKEVNGRDYFMNWKEDYWRRVSADVLTSMGSAVKWQTVYELLDSTTTPILRETQTWSFERSEGKLLLDLVWRGQALKDVTMSKFYVGGLFLRMPWRPGIPAEAVNSAGQRNAEAEGQRAIWNDVSVRVNGREDMAHITIFDHPDNNGFPNAWRVDNELGVGPSRQISGDWSIRQNETEVIRYRLIIYTGERDEPFIHRLWKAYACELVDL